MVVCVLVRASTTPRALLVVFDCRSAIGLAVDVAQMFHYFLRLNTWQEDGRNDFGLSIRPPHLLLSMLSRWRCQVAIKEHV